MPAALHACRAQRVGYRLGGPPLTKWEAATSSAAYRVFARPFGRLTVTARWGRPLRCAPVARWESDIGLAAYCLLATLWSPDG
ncbi:hypothetical protein FHU30_000776 [Actinomadura rupiterrae]|nr:hypothetical protein [Actinomadura rupiterrae]